MNQIAKWELNPIIVKELRSRMRGARAFAILTGSLVLMGAVGYALYRMTLASTQYTSSPISPQVGQMLFTGLAFMELMIIAAITPSITAGEISGEKEKQTYEMLLTTPLSGRVPNTRVEQAALPSRRAANSSCRRTSWARPRPPTRMWRR